MRLIDAEKLLASMSARYDEKKDIVSDNLAEGFMQMDKLIHEQDTFDLAEHDKQIRDEVIEDIIQEMDILNQQGKGLDDLLVYLQNVRGE